MSFVTDNSNQIVEHDVSPQVCRRLWCAVLYEQFAMAVEPKGADQPHEVASARRWFGSRDFFMVCALAGLDGSYVLGGVRSQFATLGIKP